MSWTPQVIKWKPDNLRGEVKKNVTEYVYAPDAYAFATFDPVTLTGPFGTALSNGNRTLLGG